MLVSFESVTSLQDLTLVGFNVISFIDKTFRTSFVLVVKKLNILLGLETGQIA